MVPLSGSVCAILIAATPAAAVQTDVVPAAAQPPSLGGSKPQPTSPPEAIIITGSRIPRPNLTSVSPVTVVSSEEVKREGAILTETVTNALPQVKPDQGMFLSNGVAGTSTVNLRGLGPGRTLTLINGRRLLPGDATYPAADINFVPTALIKRIEVLTGGASSVYGSDAISGVVNFILDTRLDGFRVDALGSLYQHNNRNSELHALASDLDFDSPTRSSLDGASGDLNAAYGFSFARSRAHVTIFGGFRHTDALTQAARDYSACTVSVARANSDPTCGVSGFSGVGSFQIPGFNRVYHATADRQFAPGPAFFNFGPYNYWQRPGRRYTAGLFADAGLSSALRPYAEAMYMDDRTTGQVAPSGNFGSTPTINCDNPLLSEQQRSLLCFEGNFVGQTPIFDDDGNLVSIEGSPSEFTDPATGESYRLARLRIGRRNVEGGPRQEIFGHRDLRLVGGLKGDLERGLSYDASYLYARVRQSRSHTNDFLLSRMKAALDVVADPTTGQPVCRSTLTGEEPECVPWDVFATNSASDEATAYLAVPSTLDGRVQQQVATASLTADLGEFGIRSPWADDTPGLNIGAEWRRDKLTLNPDEHYRNADLVGLGSAVPPLSGSTVAKELFGEFRVPVLRQRVLEQLTLEGGYRQSWYSNAQHRSSSSSYKLGLDLSPINGMSFRASQQRAVRAPNIQELFALPFQDFFDRDPCAGVSPDATLEQCEASGVTEAQYGRIQSQIDIFAAYNGIGGGNPKLRSETARAKTVGIVLHPQALPAFTASIDWFDIRLKGAVSVIGSQQILDTCVQTGDPLFCSRIHRDSEGSLFLSPEGYVDNSKANIGSLKTSGVDVNVAYTHRLGRLGSANVQLLGTWTRHFEVDNGGLATPYDCAGRFGNICGAPLPRWRHNARVTWKPLKQLSLSLLWRYFGRVDADEELSIAQLGQPYHPSALKIPAQSFFDLTLASNLREGIQLRVGARNLFDRQPPIVPSGPAGSCVSLCNGNTYPQIYDPLGRYVFAGATIAFRPSAT
jgi:outer membrane receptor protein involved in Fe transport